MGHRQPAGDLMTVGRRLRRTLGTVHSRITNVACGPVVGVKRAPPIRTSADHPRQGRIQSTTSLPVWAWRADVDTRSLPVVEWVKAMPSSLLVSVRRPNRVWSVST